MVLLYIVLGFFIETLSLMVVTIPIIVPMVIAQGGDVSLVVPVRLGPRYVVRVVGPGDGPDGGSFEDWSRIAVGDGWSLSQNVLAETIGAATSPVISATYANSNDERDISGAIKALDAFGEVSVMSSPKIMALNNQTSILKVVDNVVYFTQEIDREPATDNSPEVITIDTTVNTVPVGFVMNVTPFITAEDEIILNIRPTISRVLGFVAPPSIVIPGTTELLEQSAVPQIQVREMESVLRVQSGNTAVIGGLMQDTADELNAGVPGLHDAQGFGLLFGTQSRQYDKTELVIFLRPRVIDNASLDTSLSDFSKYLKPRAFSPEQSD